MNNETMKMRRVHYSLWSEGHNHPANKDACLDMPVQECARKNEASAQAVAYRNTASPFRRAVFVYESHGTLFGFFVCCSTEPKQNVYVNMYCIHSLDSEEPINRTWIRSDSVDGPQERVDGDYGN